MMMKLHKKKGFTLAELLVVVAIIAILVAIAIPVFVGATDKAKEAVDEANYRAAKAVSASMYLLHEADSTQPAAPNAKYFNATTGEFDTANTNAYQAQTDGTNPTRTTGHYIVADGAGGVRWDNDTTP